MWQTLLLPSNMKLCADFHLEYLHLTVAYYTAQGQGHAFFDSERLGIGNGDRYGKYHYCLQMGIQIKAFNLHI